MMAIPNGGGTIALYYNKTLFDTARVAYPTSHWTWQDMLSAARKITNHKTKTWGLLFTPGAMEYSLDQMVWGNGGGTVVDITKRPPQCTLTQPAATEAIQFMADAIYKWKVTPRYGFAPSTTASTPGGTAFGTGKIGMYLDGDWMVQAYHSQIKTFQWDIAYPPVGPHGTKPVTNVEIGWLVVARTTKHPREAYEFAKFYGATDEGQIKFQLPVATVDRVSALQYQIAHQSPPPAHYRIIAPMMRYGRFEWGTLWAQVDTTLTNDLNTTLSADPAHNRQVIARACADVDRVLATVKTR